MRGLQDLIYLWEEGAGARFLKFFLLFLCVVGLAVLYDIRAYKNFSDPEAMEQAQLARNLAEGRGYVTDSIKPFSIYLLQKRAQSRIQEFARQLPSDRSQWRPEQLEMVDKLGQTADLARPHPELAHPPGYPLLLAGAMSILPFKFDIPPGAKSLRYQPEVLIALLNQLLFFLAVWIVFCLARRLFDAGVAWLASITLMVSELFWRFSASGLSTMLLIVIFLLLVWCLVRLEQGAEEFTNLGKMLILAFLAGLLLAAGTLTRYSFGWLTIPVLIFMGSFLGARRILLSHVTLITFALAVAPWLARNYQYSGALFGAASYTVHEDTASMSGFPLGRALEPDFSHVSVQDIPDKLSRNLKTILTSDLPRLGGSWVSAFFLVGLLVPFRNPTIARLRYFLVLSLALFCFVQALGRTSRSVESPDVSSENLLVILAPLVFMFGVALFFTILDQARAAVWEARPLFVGGFVLMAGAPLALALLPPRAYPSAYPPYSPQLIQGLAHWMQPHELMMSDIPWAVAWYGRRQCVWLPLSYQPEFEMINRQRPVKALYLTQTTLDNRFLSQWYRGENQGWGDFIVQSLLRREVPTGFPLVKAYADLFPDQLFLTDKERWK